MKTNTRFEQLDEFYEALRALIEWLKQDGFPEESQKLDALLHTAWTTGSESLGELMLALKTMKGDYSPELRKEIEECFDFTLRYRKYLKIK